MSQTIFAKVTALFLALVLFGTLAAAAQKRLAARRTSSGKTAAKKTTASRTAAKKPASSGRAVKKTTSSRLSAKKGTRRTAAKHSSRSRQAAQRTPSGPSSDRIREIQEALAKSGQYRGEPTGRMDADTALALSRFQQESNLEATGKLSARTLKLLEKYGLPANSYAASAEPPLPPDRINP